MKKLETIKDAAAFIGGRTKNEVVTSLIIEYTGDLKAAEKWWKDNGIGAMATGFIGAFDTALIKADMDDKAVEAFIKEHGSANTLRHLSSYKARAKLARDVRATITAKLKPAKQGTNKTRDGLNYIR